MDMNTTDYLDALLSLPALYAPKVSPDGRWVAWTWLRAAPAGDVYAAPTDGSAPPLRLTDSNDDTWLVSWTPDSRGVIVTQDHDGNERDRLFRVDLTQPCALQPLTDADPNYFLRGGDLHPNGRWLVYGANLDLATGAEIEPTCVIRHDLETGERVTLARPVQGGWNAPQLSPTGGHVLYTRTDLDPAGRQTWIVDIDGANDRELYNAGANRRSAASWFPDGERVLLLADTATHRRLGVLTLADGSLRWLIDDPARQVEDAYAPRGSNHIVVLEVRGARLQPSLLDPVSGEERSLTPSTGNLQPLAPLAAGGWAGSYYSARWPADVMRFAPDDLEPAHFTSLTGVWSHTALTPADLAPAEDYRWPADDGLEIQGWLYRAQGAARGTIVYVHGGPTAHSEDKLDVQIQFFVHNGFNVLDPNYRGSTGFGLAFREAIKADGWGGSEQMDIRAGIAALIAAGIAQPGAVGITGTSYGGYAAWHAITHFPPQIIAAAAPICGMTDLVVDYETTRPDLRPLSAAMMGGTPEQAPDRYRERSPIHFVDNIRGRLLIVQGLMDPNVTPQNVHAVTAVLDAAGVAYALLTFADEGHGIMKPRNVRRLLLALEEFFAAALAGA
jgi:dipeptidyl aminopeptidase/acylaminoacyl peptidase